MEKESSKMKSIKCASTYAFIHDSIFIFLVLFPYAGCLINFPTIFCLEVIALDIGSGELEICYCFLCHVHTNINCCPNPVLRLNRLTSISDSLASISMNVIEPWSNIIPRILFLDLLSTA